MKDQKIKTFAIEANLAFEIAEYLSKRPFREVFELMQGLNRLQPLDKNPEEEKCEP